MLCANLFFQYFGALYEYSIGKDSIALCAELGMLPVKIARGCAQVCFSSILV
jgi:hypothetical protein